MHACPKCGVSCACDSTACQHKCGSLVTLCFVLVGNDGEDLLLRDPRDGKTFRLTAEAVLQTGRE